jgi:hypothetical protein
VHEEEFRNDAFLSMVFAGKMPVRIKRISIYSDAEMYLKRFP